MQLVFFNMEVGTLPALRTWRSEQSRSEQIRSDPPCRMDFDPETESQGKAPPTAFSGHGGGSVPCCLRGPPCGGRGLFCGGSRSASPDVNRECC